MDGPQEPLQVEIELPVFLPGSNRDWREVRAKGIIASDGVIVIKILNAEDRERLVDFAREGILYQMSFDYRMSIPMIDKINQQYKETPDGD